MVAAVPCAHSNSDGALSFTSLLGFVVLCFPGDSRYGRVEIESQSSLNLHFPDG